ncbi:uracil phosphoribosyltransferase [Roseomonas sp. NAR14]|uniref:Uracil phosphoribosyltransferase n=1 Tax=Roseomonas acroporae TaxID=2937791 RepID=A0A9X1YB86_9PROT|nr:uracil phosphoribosyltransferase [Roseomonas acroporae]MCK8785477.1 uracil phosphoribosyltransferase [Roseomonas acroporae]
MQPPPGSSSGPAAVPSAGAPAPGAFPGLVVPDHALLRHKLAALRDRETPSAAFRRLLAELGALLTAEATRDLPQEAVRVATPLAEAQARVLPAEPCLVAVLRAGLGLLEGARSVLPEAPVGHIGLVRDERTLQPSEYVVRLPPGLARRGAIVLDPMLATGGSAVAAVARVKAAGPAWVRFVCVVAAPEGVARLLAAHPDVPVLAASLDSGLDARGYIVPGLGDAGDRCFGTEG